MKRQKVRHQLFLTKELSARLDRIASGTGRARSQLLVEALEVWLNRRSPPAADEAVGARLKGVERHIEAVRRQQRLQWEVLARMLRHQLLAAAALPPADAAAQASVLRAFEAFLDELAERAEGGEPRVTTDRTIQKIRRLAL